MSERDYVGDVVAVHHDPGMLQVRVWTSGGRKWHINLDRCTQLPAEWEPLEVVTDAGRNRVLEIWIGGRRYQ